MEDENGTSTQIRYIIEIVVYFFHGSYVEDVTGTPQP